jgi:hypothetical protein
VSAGSSTSAVNPSSSSKTPAATTPQVAQQLSATPDPPVDPEHSWSHALHVDSLFIQRGNFYLLAHSMLVVAYTAALATASSTHQSALSWVARVLAGFGLLLAFVWLYVSHSQWAYVRYLRNIAIQVIPRYAWSQRTRPRGPIEDGTLSAYVVPGMAAVMWAVLIPLA